MSQSTESLTVFLLARIAEDEAAARAVEPLDFNYDMGGNRQDQRWVISRTKYAGEDGMPSRHADPGAEAHFMRYTPARVLAECAAKRRIVEAFFSRIEDSQHPHGEVFGYHATGLGIAIRLLAVSYGDHRDYRDEWRP